MVYPHRVYFRVHLGVHEGQGGPLVHVIAPGYRKKCYQLIKGHINRKMQMVHTKPAESKLIIRSDYKSNAIILIQEPKQIIVPELENQISQDIAF